MSPITEHHDSELVSGLFWSNSGEIACARNAPLHGGPRWLEERWQPLPVRSVGSDYRCQHCRREERRTTR